MPRAARTATGSISPEATDACNARAAAIAQPARAETADRNGEDHRTEGERREERIVDAEQIVGAELAVEPLSFFKPAESAAVLASDPFEPVNRLVFGFNEQLDRRLIRPVARVYLQTLPGPLRDGFSNMLLNLDDLVSFLNQLLQAKPSKAALFMSISILNFMAHRPCLLSLCPNSIKASAAYS